MDKSNIYQQLISFRKELHQYPEVSGEESETAERVIKFLEDFNPDRIIKNMGGYGLAAEFKGDTDGPTVMFRCELDGLPIQEKNTIPYRSAYEGKAHLCGHDGHMAMVSGLAIHLSEQRPRRGSVVLLFQPSEETGKGAEQLLKDPLFKEIEPDYIFAIHNLPGYPLHEIILSSGHFAAASSGMVIELTGKSSHAAEPEKGINPSFAMAMIIQGISDMMKAKMNFKDLALATPIHMKMGSLAYGTSPGFGVVHLTLRSYLNDDMEKLKSELTWLIKSIADREKLELNYFYEEEFPATINDREYAGIISNIAEKENLDSSLLHKPFKWSEDFGHFLAKYKGALMGLGSGKEQPALHNPDYDFPDQLIPTGITLFKGIYEHILNQ
jgi:amidohydrolase